MEVEAVDEGTLGKILVAEGTEGVAVNTPIARAGAEGEERRPTPPGAAAGRERRRRRRHAARPTPPRPTPSPRRSRRRKPAPPAARRPPPSRNGPARPSHMTVREALRDAMAEEMRRDDNVFLMGEEVAEYQGAYKVSQGLLEEFGAEARDRHADHRARLRRPRRRRGVRAGCGRSSSS